MTFVRYCLNCMPQTGVLVNTNMRFQTKVRMYVRIALFLLVFRRHGRGNQYGSDYRSPL